MKTKKVQQPYVPRQHYTWAEQVEMYRKDLLSDADCSEDPVYADECRAGAADAENGLIKALGYKRCPEIEKLFTTIVQ